MIPEAPTGPQRLSEVRGHQRPQRPPEARGHQRPPEAFIAPRGPQSPQRPRNSQRPPDAPRSSQSPQKPRNPQRPPDVPSGPQELPEATRGPQRPPEARGPQKSPEAFRGPHKNQSEPKKAGHSPNKGTARVSWRRSLMGRSPFGPGSPSSKPEAQDGAGSIGGWSQSWLRREL